MFEEEIKVGDLVEYTGRDPYVRHDRMIGVRARVVRILKGAYELDYTLGRKNYIAVKSNIRLIAPPKLKWRV